MSMRISVVVAGALLLAPFAAINARDVVQEDTKIAFEDVITIDRGEREHELRITGVGLREATIMKINVYAVASYVERSQDLGGDPASAIIAADCAKRIDMRFVRGVEAKKIAGAYRDGIKKNFKKDTEDFAEDFEDFLEYFDVDVEEGASIVITYLPEVGLITEVTGKGELVQSNPHLAKALWSIWFGKKPVSKGMKKDLLTFVAGD